MSGRWPRTALIFLCFLVCLAGIARGATLNSIIVSKYPVSCPGNPPRGGSTLFLQTDPYVYVWFELAGIRAGDAVKLEYNDPEEQLRWYSYWPPDADSGSV